jgi:ABC-type glycerol-3-phosphate transport system permease component
MPRRYVRPIVTFALLGAWTLPFLWMVIASLLPESQLFGGLHFVPRAFGLQHYRALFSDRNFWLPIRNSLIVATGTTALAILLGTPCAYAMARLHFRGRAWLLSMVIAVSVFPQIAIVSPLFLTLRAAGLIDTFAGLILPYQSFAMPLAVWLLVGYFEGLPREIEEAARMDGAGHIRVGLEITLPLAAPAVATTAILTFLYAWNEFLFALAFTLGPERQTVPVAIALFRGQYQVPWGQVLAGAVVASLPVILIVLALQRRIVAGLVAGAVKG